MPQLQIIKVSGSNNVEILTLDQSLPFTHMYCRKLISFLHEMCMSYLKLFIAMIKLKLANFNSPMRPTTIRKHTPINVIYPTVLFYPMPKTKIFAVQNI